MTAPRGEVKNLAWVYPDIKRGLWVVECRQCNTTWQVNMRPDSSEGVVIYLANCHNAQIHGKEPQPCR